MTPLETPAVTNQDSAPELKIPSGRAYDEWRMTGELPSEPEAPAASEPETPAEPPSEQSADSAPAEKSVSPAAPEAAPTAQRGKKDAEARIRELVARVKELEARQSTSVTPTSQAAPITPKLPEKSARPPKPTVNDRNPDGSPKYKDLQEFLDACDEWTTQDVLAKSEEALSKREADRKASERAQTVQSKRQGNLDRGLAKHPDWGEKVGKMQLPDILDAFTLESDVGDEILYHFAANPAEFQRVFSMPSAFRITRELGKLEDQFSGQGSAERSSSPPVRRVSAAPPPPQIVDGKGTTPGDDVESALNDDDFAAYAARQNRRDVERMKKR